LFAKINSGHDDFQGLQAAIQESGGFCNFCC